MSTELRSVLHSQACQDPPGRLAHVKEEGETSDPGSPQPQAAEGPATAVLR
jgi:hypothetical protein